MKKRSGLFLLFSSISLLCAPVSAGTVGPNCTNCFGGVYTLNAVQLATAAPAGFQNWRLSVGLDFTGDQVPASTNRYISAIGIHVASGLGNLDNFSTVSLPTSGNWNDGILGVTGCDDGITGWTCLQYNSGNQILIDAHSTYSWVFDVAVRNGTMELDDSTLYVNFNRVGQPLSLAGSMWESVSLRPSTAVPEGTATELPILLSGLGLLIVWRKCRSLRPVI
jgi:hypothetical protein